MVLIYCRVSTLLQKDNYSVDTQKERGRAFAQKVGEPFKIYDETKSGKDLERPEFVRLVDEIQKHARSKVWVIEASRLTRDVEHAQIIRKMFLKHHVELFVNDQHMDLSTSESILTYNITSAISEYERSKIIDRVKRSRRKQIEDGYGAFSSIFGYDYKYNEKGRKVWYLNEQEAAVIRMIFNLYGKGLAYVKIVNNLNDNGYRTKKNRKWTVTTIAKLLGHPEYFGRTRDPKGNLIQSKVYPPILDEATYKKLQDQHENRKRAYHKFRVSKSELSGLLRCKKCKAHYYVHRSKHYSERKQKKYLYVRYAHKSESTEQIACKNAPKYINKELLEHVVFQLYLKIFSDYSEIEKFLKNKKKDIFLEEKQIASQIEEIQSQLLSVEARRKKLIDGVMRGLYTNEDIEENIGKLNDEKAAFETNIGFLEDQVRVKEQNYGRYLDTYSDKHIEDFATATPEMRRKFYTEAISDFHVADGKLQIDFITGLTFSFETAGMQEFYDSLTEPARTVERILSKGK
jgi:site-specific DNA recombinase